MFKGDTGKVRKVLAEVGYTDLTIYNNKSKDSRSFKVAEANELVELKDTLVTLLRKEFGERFVKLHFYKQKPFEHFMYFRNKVQKDSIALVIKVTL